MSGSKNNNPFLPPNCQDEPIDNPFNDGSIERYAKLQLTEYEVAQLAEADADLIEDCPNTGCVLCWSRSGFKTKFVAGKPTNKICKNCEAA